MGDVPAIPPQGAVLVPFVLTPPAQNGSSEIAVLANFDPEHVPGEKRTEQIQHDVRYATRGRHCNDLQSSTTRAVHIGTG